MLARLSSFTSGLALPGVSDSLNSAESIEGIGEANRVRKGLSTVRGRGIGRDRRRIRQSMVDFA